MKKIVSVLLCLVMAMSLCTAAFAAGTEKEYCTCGGPQLQFDNGDGTHSAMCTICGMEVEYSTTPHVYQYDNPKHEGNANPNGKYCICGAEKPAECQHENLTYTDEGDGTHSCVCKDCGNPIPTKNGPHKFADGKCTLCGFVCKHGDKDMWSYIRVDETYHKTVCKVCDTVVNANVKHNFVDGKCTLCGFACDHVGADVQKVVDNKDGMTHKVICTKCNAVITEKAEHVFDAKTGKCACGAVKAACDHVGVQNVVDNKDGKTHKVICPKCDAVITEKAEHVFDAKTGKCACGAEKPACKHEGAQKLVPNKDKKTHNAYCPVCNELMAEKIPHTYQYNKKGEFVGKGGAYCLCGAKKSTSSAGSNTGSTTTTTTTTKSPKTGDMGVVLYAATALLSLSGTAVVIKKRKNDK